MFAPHLPIYVDFWAFFMMLLEFRAHYFWERFSFSIEVKSGIKKIDKPSKKEQKNERKNKKKKTNKELYSSSNQKLRASS